VSEVVGFDRTVGFMIASCSYIDKHRNGEGTDTATDTGNAESNAGKGRRR
jgi:hypothetical protein